MIDFNDLGKHIWQILGAVFGWFVAEFNPTFPLAIVAVIFIVYDAWTAYKLDKRVKSKYPEQTKHDAKFTSFAFGKTIRQTIPNRLCLIFLGYMVEHWVFIHTSIPLSYIITGIICFEQALSIAENESSCRPESEGIFWQLLKKVLIDKTSRHLDIDLSDITKDKDNQSKQ